MSGVQIIICAAILIFMVLCCGCTTAPGKVTEVNSTNTVPSTTVATVNPTPGNTVIPQNTTVIPTPFVGVSSGEINLHFMDLAFGGGNVYLERFPASTLQNNFPTTISISNGNPDDIKIVEGFVSEFNDLSASTRLSENVKEGVTGQIQIKFVPSDGLSAIDLSALSTDKAAPSSGWLNKEFKNGGVTNAKVKDKIIYISSDLAGAERKHYILLGLLFELGFKGSTMKYQDSIFFDGGTDVTSLSRLDSKAVQIMYGLGLWNGMTVEDVKKRVLVTSS